VTVEWHEAKREWKWQKKHDTSEEGNQFEQTADEEEERQEGDEE
jgi:hypothetical protein